MLTSLDSLRFASGNQLIGQIGRHFVPLFRHLHIGKLGVVCTLLIFLILGGCGGETAGPDSSISSSSASHSSIDSSQSSSTSSTSSALTSSNTLFLEESSQGFCQSDSIPIESEHQGFTGTGYANTENRSGAGLVWKINNSVGGWFTAKIRYANGGDADRPGTLQVNSGSDGDYTFSFVPGDSWSDWKEEEFTLFLQEGEADISLTSDSEAGLPNIDHLAITGFVITPLTCHEPLPPANNGEPLAFPGAQGYGRFAVGGRHGEVVHVTNLNDSGPGSLRDAISQPNRIVVFDVGGVIHLESRLVFKSNQTIAGQTAPGDGITLYGDGTSFSGANNTIVRYIRFRMGAIGSSGKDTVGMANGHDVIWDHCSLSWGRDGTLDLNQESGRDLYNITLQDSIVAQGLQTHSTGGLVNTQGTSIIRSLYIDNNSRNPKARGTLQFVNNVIYNWVVSGYILGDTSGRSDGAMIGNYLIAGPETRGGTLNSPTPAYNLFARDNWYDSNKDGELNGRLLGAGDFGSVTWWEQPSVEYPSVPALSAAEALNHVIANAGASLNRDAVDTFLMDELQSWGRRGATISNETSLGFPGVVGNIRGGTTPLDSDRDGIPDAWEQSHGLDPNNPADAMMDRNNDGWVNIEEYINDLVPSP